ncbi:hypothetical protein AMAG_02898 [Allomyces macrogynus ATCC 38327]|uniref:Uncharacterized protein n=1 Tax=Allomyces macrogynus (strain ATCC 38327) TaxID=578462 RepID=A0A0L0S427_ALLM3|nr:hypothetical protein AMAG_02898 [Allomyces macrogynus ATCC 38327]|eukprot:KNE57151.1 hypothetical protein AMAG_02898 [Allomyces macrogynus ATCC 38327]
MGNDPIKKVERLITWWRVVRIHEALEDRERALALVREWVTQSAACYRFFDGGLFSVPSTHSSRPADLLHQLQAEFTDFVFFLVPSEEMGTEVHLVAWTRIVRQRGHLDAARQLMEQAKVAIQGVKERLEAALRAVGVHPSSSSVE